MRLISSGIQCLLILFLSCASAHLIYAQTADVIEATLDEGESIRSLARQHLGDANDWEVIVLYNGYESPNDIAPGTTVKIPVTLYKEVLSLFVDIQRVLSEANREGAGILARDLIGEANQNRDKAIELKEAGRLARARETAASALSLAREALQTAREKRVQAITAILDQKNGIVQARTPAEATWQDVEEDEELIERERVRTLSNSTGAIAFVDGSRLQLGENSLAVIESMKEDVIKKTRSANVVVMQGDISAYLSSLSQKNEVNVSTPGVETDIRSRRFQASRDENRTARYANYDGEIDLTASGETVTLQLNEGSTITEGTTPSPPKSLLPVPEPVAPEPGAKLFSKKVTFQWERVPAAQSYRLEVAGNKSFTDIVEQRMIRDKVSLNWQFPTEGVYYWQVSAIDNDALTGPASDAREIIVSSYDVPPSLSVRIPKQNATVYTKTLTVKGTVESGVEFKINEIPVEPESDGTFSHSLTLKEGQNSVKLVATDGGGNTTALSRMVTVNLDDRLLVLDQPAEFSVTEPSVTFSGTVKPGVQVTVGKQTADIQNNRLNHLVNLDEGIHDVHIVATAPDGEAQEFSARVVVDQTPPQIRIEGAQSFSKKPAAHISGTLTEQATLTLDDSPLTTIERGFNAEVQLREGDNSFTLRAEDQAGNTSTVNVTITRDTQYPTIQNVSVSPEQLQSGGVVQVRVDATDDGAGLARTAKFALQVGDDKRLFRGSLNLVRGENRYEGSVFIPPNVQGNVRVTDLTVTDYLGNESTRAN